MPINAFFVQSAYLLTGETITSRGQIKPLCPFDLRKGKFGLGAWEVHGRYSFLNVGDNVFTDGYANPDLWSSQAYAIDTGVNWYWNQYVKIYFDWQHAVFGRPVYDGGDGLLHKTSDMLWVRFQLYF
ncbi:MAG: hypothetical protein IRY99_14175 [Isosphaeraceae bacterium]|nr:hypothetical protein [Isosphaeraceae bacterium]